MKTVIILGSSRQDGEAKALTDQLQAKTNWDLIDLNDYAFSYYDYSHRNKTDDFIPLMRTIIGKYDTIVFATPVYWYAMSGILKVFFDRITDLLTIEKDLGRALRGKKMATISCSYGNNLGTAFWLPFEKSADYLGMAYLASAHTIALENNDSIIQEFIDKVDAD